METKKYRTILLSDIHLGTRACKIDLLLDFIKHNECETLILLGDISDFWALKRTSYWPPSHNTLIQKILRLARHGTKVIFIPGNHDEVMRQYVGLSFGNIDIHHDYIHVLADGKKMWCLHGDEFDIITKYHKWLAWIGDIGYGWLLQLNTFIFYFRKMFNLSYWSVSSYAKSKIKNAVNYISDFEHEIVKMARNKDIDVVACGHIHNAEKRFFGEILYLNTGDWVESCTAIVEEYSGEISIVKHDSITNRSA